MARKPMRDLTVEQQLARGPMDLPFLMLVVMLVGIGLIVVFSASYAAALSDRVSYIDALLMRYSSGKDMLTGYANKINAVQPQQVQAILGTLSQGRKVEYVIR